MSSLRSFTGATTPAVVFDHPVNLVGLDGVVGAAGYLLLFNQTTTPVNNDVPAAIIQISAAGPVPSLSSILGPMTFSRGLAVAISSTSTPLTIVSTTYNFWGSVEEWEINPADEPTVVQTNYPSAATGVLQTFWSDPDSSGSKLLTAVATNAVASPRHLLLFATSNPADGAVPISHWLIPASSTKRLHFGSAGGLEVFSIGTDGVKHSGCTLVWSTTAPLLTRSVAEAHTITGTYRYTA